MKEFFRKNMPVCILAGVVVFVAIVASCIFLFGGSAQ